MSRSGYTDDCENLAMWRGQVASAIRGQRGQQFFRDLIVALDAMPEKKLIAGELQENGCVCTLGALAVNKGIDPDSLDPYAYRELGRTFNIARQLAQEVMYENDEGSLYQETPERRWTRMREWAVSQLAVSPQA